MTRRLPMFPLNTVVFPGTELPLHVFEERYRALVQHLQSVPDPLDRVFGVVAIREGYEVGDHGAQSLYRVGCRVRLLDVEQRDDGTYDVVAVGLDRFVMHRLDASGPFPVGEVDDRPDDADAVPEEVAARARGTFTAYRAALEHAGLGPFAGRLPRDPAYLSYGLAAAVPLPLAERQSLLETDDVGVRLSMLTDLLRDELRAVNVIPSLPAAEVARTRWSPN